MVAIRSRRFLTFFVVSAACVYGVIRGVDLIRFQIATASFGAGVDFVNAMKPWMSSRSTAVLAREAAISGLRMEGDWIAKRKEALIELLTERPMSSRNWLALASMSTSVGSPSGTAIGALVMSSLTGPNESAVMTQRAIVGLSLWENLPAEVQMRVASDLAGAKPNPTEGVSLRTFMAGKPPEVRKEIRSSLLARNLTANDLAELGL